MPQLKRSWQKKKKKKKKEHHAVDVVKEAALGEEEGGCVLGAVKSRGSKQLSSDGTS